LIVAVEVKDVGSGATTRPLREKLIETARREIDSVIVWRLDRWGRSRATVEERPVARDRHQHCPTAVIQYPDDPVVIRGARLT
jgi:Resolvase, N terminal domain